MGTVGVGVRSTQGVRNRYLAEQLVLGFGQLGFHQGESASLGMIEGVTNEIEGLGLGHSLKDFQESLKALTADPSDVALRQVVLEEGRELSYMFRHTRSEIEQGMNATFEDVKDMTKKVNTLAKLIADLNAKIRLKQGLDTESEAMISERNGLVQEIGQLIQVTPITQDNGSVSLYTAGGRMLVEDKFANELKVGPPGGAPNYAIKVQITSINGPLLDPIKSYGGHLGGALQAYDEVLVTSLNRVDEIAFEFMNAFNAQHQAGFALDGTTGNDFFAPPGGVAGAAANMALDPIVNDQPERIAAAANAADLPGGNTNLFDLANIIDAPGILPDGTSPTEAWDGIVALVTHRIQSAELGITTEHASVSQLKNLHSSETAVNLDEELIAMAQAKTAFDAASRVIRAADEMALAVLQMVR